MKLFQKNLYPLMLALVLALSFAVVPSLFAYDEDMAAEEGWSDDYISSGDADFYDADYSYEKSDDDGETAEALISRVEEARAAVEAAKNGEEEIDPAKFEELLAEQREAEERLEEFCATHGYTVFTDDETGAISVRNSQGEAINRVGDPVLLASGIFQIDDTDMTVAVGRTHFALTRHYSSDASITGTTAGGAFGDGWYSVLDSRIILGQSQSAVAELQKWEALVALGQEKLTEIEGYVAEDSDCASIQDEMQELLDTWTTQRDAYAVVAQRSAARAQKSAFVSYGYPGMLSRTLGCDNIIFVDDFGKPLVFTAVNGTYQATNVIVQRQVALSYDDATDCYDVVVASGERRQYNGWGLLTAITYTHGGTVHFSYTASQQLASISVNGVRTVYCTWAEGHLASVSNGTQTVSYQFENDRLQSVCDAEGDVKSFAYGADGRIVKQIKHDGTFVTFGYETGTDGIVRAIYTVDENGAKECFSYDVAQRRTTYTDHDGVVSFYDYDAYGRTIRESYADGNVISYQYDERGNLALQETRGMRVAYRYDEKDHRVAATYSDGSSEQWLYADDTLLSYTDRDGIITRFDYDTAKNVTAVYRGNQLVASYVYTQFGLVAREADCHGNRREYTYDAQGNCLKKTLFAADALLATEVWTYDDIGRITTYRDARGISYTYQYAPHAMTVRTSNGYEQEWKWNGRKDTVLWRRSDTVTGETRTYQYEYDNMHRITRVLLSGTDSKGNHYDATPVQSFLYTAQGRLAQQITWGTAEQWAVQYQFDDAGLVVRCEYGAADAYGVLPASCAGIVYERALTATGYTISSKTYDDRTIARTYDARGLLQEERDGNIIRQLRQYSAGGRLVASQIRTGGTLLHAYDGETGYYAGTEESNGTVGRTVVACYADGKQFVSTNPTGNATYYYYDAFGAVSRMVSDGSTEIWERDGAGRLRLHVIMSPQGTVVKEERWSYSADARTISYTKGKNGAITACCNAFGEVLSVTDGAGNKRAYTYDLRGQCIEAIDAYGKKTQFFYNGKQQLVRVVNRNGHAVTYAYDAMGNCTKITDASGIVFSATYDMSGRVLSKKQLPAMTAETYTYDGNDRITAIRQGDDIQVQTAFSADGTSFLRYDAKGRAATYTTDGFGRILAEKNRVGATQYFSFKADGALRQMTDFIGTVGTYDYERTTRTMSVLYPDGSYTKEIRDAAGNIVAAENQSESLVFTYDTAGNVLTQYDKHTDALITYTYDACGRRIRLKSDKQDIRYTYGKNGELLKIEDSVNRLSVQFTYDAEGHEIMRLHDTGEYLASFYDAADRLILSVGYAPNGAVIFVEGSVYDENGFRSLVLNTDLSVTRYRYDLHGHIASVQYAYTEANAAHLAQLCAEAGLHYSETAAVRTSYHQFSSAEHESLQALCAFIGTGLLQPQTNGATLEEQFTYDANGNLISRITPFGTIRYTYDAEDRLVTWGEAGFAQYDANGNLLEEKNLYGRQVYQYNVHNRVEHMTRQDNLLAEVTTYTCTYDAFGRRTTVASSETGVMRSVYDGFSLNDVYVVRERAAHDRTTAQDEPAYRYVWIEDADNGNRTRTTPTARTTKNQNGTAFDDGYVSLYGNSRAPVAVARFSTTTDSRYVLFSDVVGTVRTSFMTDGSAQHFSYDTFGARTASDGWNPYGFAGKKSLGTTDLYDFGFRDYAADTFRFTTPDPARDGTNWYAYCNGDSVNYVDPWGLLNLHIADTDMHGEDWKDDNLGNSTTNTVGREGCVVSGMSEVINALTGSELTPKDINDNKENFLEGSDKADFNAMAENYDIQHDYWTAARQGSLEDKIDELNNSTVQYGVLAQVQYGKDADDLHWVGLNGGVVSIEGMPFVCVSQTSMYDNVTVGSSRAEAGWVKGADGNIYVPVSNVARLETYTTGYRGDLYYAINKSHDRKEVEVALAFKESIAAQKAQQEKETQKTLSQKNH